MKICKFLGYFIIYDVFCVVLCSVESQVFEKKWRKDMKIDFWTPTWVPTPHRHYISGVGVRICVKKFTFRELKAKYFGLLLTKDYLLVIGSTYAPLVLETMKFMEF